MRVSVDSEALARQLVGWEHAGTAKDFPYESVLSLYRAVGKHFVPVPVLTALAAIRERIAERASGDGQDGDPEKATLLEFLNVALDKWYGTYNYQTYLGLELLGLEPDATVRTGRRQYDEITRMLLADASAFERDARDGRHDLLPLMRPSSELADKRIRMLDGCLSAGVSGCRASEREKRALALSMQPVYVIHDEYLFIRILQSFEATFAAMAAQIRAAIAAARIGDADSAVASLCGCSGTLASARSLFAVLATMRVEAFRAFRVYTVGASAIQSGNYKIFEALCSRPAQARIKSPAYESVPQVRDRVVGQWTDLLSTIELSASRGLIDAGGLGRIRRAARELENVHQMWKRTHWKMADRMIGEERGTGYTVGVPYLKSALENRLFWTGETA